MRWCRREVTLAVPGPLGVTERELSAERRGNVTPAHRELIAALTESRELQWSGLALLSCLRWLCTSTLTAAFEVQVEEAWTDGSDAFCIVYRAPYGPQTRVGIRSHRDEGDMFGSVDAAGHGPDPEEFGQQVADFNIGEPLGDIVTRLRSDQHGVGWWGSLGDHLPTRPSTRD